MDIRHLKGIGEKTSVLLKKLGVNTIHDLINFYPRTYENWENPLDLQLAIEKKNCCVRVKILSEAKSLRLKNGNYLYKILAVSDNNNLEILFFNSKYSAQNLKVNSEYLLMGKIIKNAENFQIISPKVHEGKQKLVPVYNQCNGISSKKISNFIKTALEDQKYIENKEFLPNSITKENNLSTKDFAIKNIHFPQDSNCLAHARERLVFEEFFFYYLNMKSIKRTARQKTNKIIHNNCAEEFYSLLPFNITDSQKNVISECLDDMKDLSMNRLLQGDVGSGKTVIAATLAYVVVKNGYQVAVMVPTAVLAIQHYETFCKLFKNTGINIVLIYGSMRTSEKKFAYENIKTGIANIIIGTHAVISDKICFKNMGLIITDEQHRFGVRQREALVDKGDLAHTLIMSATPVPRSLAMVLYGDLDVSVLSDVLPGRQKIDTFFINSNKRTRMFNFLSKNIAEGNQIYIVCAVIEKNENGILDVQTCKEMLLEHGFLENNIAVLHSKMNSLEKDSIMQQFSKGNIKILISTTVIEVGINVPNATVIVIENAERFGISQLHQLRGRVGRGNKKSYCILVSDSKSKETLRRFHILTSSNDGFYLSEEDLKTRGPGDFFGVNQHGIPNIKISTNSGDMVTIYKAQEWAKKVSEEKVLLSPQETVLIKSRLDSIQKANDTQLKNKTIIF